MFKTPFSAAHLAQLSKRHLSIPEEWAAPLIHSYPIALSAYKYFTIHLIIFTTRFL